MTADEPKGGRDDRLYVWSKEARDAFLSAAAKGNGANADRVLVAPVRHAQHLSIADDRGEVDVVLTCQLRRQAGGGVPARRLASWLAAAAQRCRLRCWLLFLVLSLTLNWHRQAWGSMSGRLSKLIQACRYKPCQNV